ncbi:TPA: hypothetical protein JG906_001450 [Enterobacter hormaechei subsp. steigerwaltii]|nr:hypothetical protein [Enterobacter hormaechei subsp. steigerwaltii]
MPELNAQENERLNVADELSELMRGRPLDTIQYDNLCRFMIYFSLSESKISEIAAGFGRTDDLARKLITHNGFNQDVIDDCYAYFIGRYRDQPNSENRFNRLAPARHVFGPQRQRFVELLHKQEPSLEERISFVFKVVFRLRHNLFHGEKWSYNLQGQDANFSHAVTVLLSTLTLTRGEIWHP